MWSEPEPEPGLSRSPVAGVRVTITLPPPLSPILPEPGLVSVSTLRWRGSHPEPERVVTEEHRGHGVTTGDKVGRVTDNIVWRDTNHDTQGAMGDYGCHNQRTNH